MKTQEEIFKELDQISNDAVEAAEAFCEAMKAFKTIDLGTGDDEEIKKLRYSVIAEADSRKAFILRRILIEYGYLLFL